MCGVSTKPVLSWVAQLVELDQVIVLNDHKGREGH